MRGIKFWIITLLGLFISVVLKGQYVEIIGTFNVCPNQVYTYEVDILDPDACLYGIEWTIDGGEIQNSATSEELKVIWDDTGGEIAVSVDISFRVNCDAKDDNFDTSQPITSKSKLSGSFTSFNIIQNEVSNPTSLSFCDICNLSVNAITDEKNNQVRYYWKYSTNGSDFHHLRTTTSNSTNAIIENLQEVDNTQDSIIYFKVIAYSLCSSYYETIGTGKKKIKYCFEDLDSDIDNPTCYDSTNAVIEINNIPDPAYYQASYNSCSALDKDSFDITITKYYYVGADDCQDHAGQGDAPDKEALPGLYADSIVFCPSGYVFNHSFESSETIILNKNNVVLKDNDPTTDDVEGLNAGFYKIVIENPLFYPDSVATTEITAPDTLWFNSADTVNSFGDEDYGYYNVSSPDASDGKVKLDIVGGTGSYSYFLNGDNNNLSSVEEEENQYFISQLNTSIHIVNIKDENGCLPYGGSKNISLTAPDPIVIDTTALNPVSCNINDGGYSANGGMSYEIEGGIGPFDIIITNLYSNIVYSYTVSGGDTTGNFLEKHYGNYKLKVTDETGVQKDSIEIKIEQPDPLNINVVNIKNPVCFNIKDGTAEIDVSGGTPDYYKYILYDTNMIEINDFDQSIIEELGANQSYYIKVIDAYDCFQFRNFETGDYTNPLQFDVQEIIPPACIGGNTGEIIIKGKGGHDTYYDERNIDGFNSSKAFNSVNNTVKIYNLEASTYTFKLSDSYDCFYTEDIEIGENPSPVRIQVIDSTEITCNSYNDGLIEFKGLKGDTLSGTGYSFYIDNMDIPYANGSTVKRENLTPGWHTLAIADNNDCMNDIVNSDKDFYKKHIFVNEPDTIRISKEIQPVIIKGTNTGKITFTLSGGNEMFEYRFTDKNDSILNTGTTDHKIVLDSLYAGDYFLMLKDTCGCTNGLGKWLTLNTITISEPEKYLDIIIGFIDTVKCSGGKDGAVILKASGGHKPYTYGMDIHNIDSDIPEFAGLSSGSYTFYVKDKYGVIDSVTEFVPENAELIAGIDTKQDVSCYSGSNGFVSLNIEGGTPPYFYSIGHGESWVESNDIPALSAGEYQVLVKDINECSDSLSFKIEQPPILAVDSISITGAVCGESNGSATIWMAGGTKPYQYLWHNKNGEILSEANNIENKPGGIYRVYVIDSLGCDTTINVIIDNTNGPILSVTKTVPETCSGYNDGQVFFTVSDTMGTLPFRLDTYYNNGEDPLFTTSGQPIGTDSLVGLSSGEYTLKLTDNNGCISTKQFTITSPVSMSVAMVEKKGPLCFGYSDGIIEVTGEGGNGGYHYLWNNETSNARITDLPAGDYRVTVTDKKGCSAEANYSLTDPELLIVNIGDDIALCEGQLYPLSAGHFHTYHWSYNGNPISTDSAITISEHGEYSIRVEDESGCIATDTVFVTVSTDLLEADFLMASEAVVNDTIVIVDVSWPYPDDSEWILGAGIKSVSTEPYIDEITFESPGIYEVKLITELAMCIDSLTKSINVTHPDTENKESYKLGADEPLITQFNVFPNPNSGQFTIDTELSEVCDVEIRIFDLQHNSFVWIEQLYNSDKYLIEYNFSNLKSSVYLITIKARDERMAKRVLITK